MHDRTATADPESADEPPVIRARVNARLLGKADRLFTGTLEGRVIELLQNARRAGAEHVEITNSDGIVTVQDDGHGIDDFAKLLDLGGSGWEEAYEASEDPAGVGLFCLAPRDIRIRSKGHVVDIMNAGWRGEPVAVLPDCGGPETGTIVQFEDDEWSHAIVSPLAVFSGLNVAVDDCPCPREAFVRKRAVHHPALGCRIEVREAEKLTSWHRAVRRERVYGDNVLVNFHGQTVSFDFHPVSEQKLWFLVDLTGEPTGIRLMLPARTQLVENEAFEALKAALELEAYRYVQRRGRHRLPYQQYLRARALGVKLPEATPTFHVGLLSTCESPEPVEVTMPKGFALARCYRFDADAAADDTDETNIHLLAALGTFPAPFVPVSIRKEYDGYSWAELPVVRKVTLTVGKELHSAGLWSGTLTCVDTLAIAVETSDGKVFSSPVCLAKAPPPEGKDGWCDDAVLVTWDAKDELVPSQIWYHLGGWSEDGDTYDTQLNDFEQELNRFWADLLGPDEQLRRSILAAVTEIRPEWQTVLVAHNGTVTIRLPDGSEKVIRPPDLLKKKSPQK
jgi:hypothetical protein